MLESTIRPKKCARRLKTSSCFAIRWSFEPFIRRSCAKHFDWRRAADQDAICCSGGVYHRGIASGERSLETHVSTTPRTEHKAGQATRLVDVPVQGKYGLFDDLHGHANGKLFSEALLQGCQKHYGHAAPMFIKALIDKMPTLDLHARLNACYQKFGDTLTAQEGRVARTFACVALAGEMATEWKVLPWKQGEALAAACNIFDRWRKAQPQSATSREHAQILKKVADFIEKHGSSRFSGINWKPSVNLRGGEEKEPVIHNRAGYWEDKNNNRMFLFNSAGLREATDPYDFRRVLKALHPDNTHRRIGRRLNGLEKNDEQYTSRKWNNGRSAYFHHTCLWFCHGPLPRLPGANTNPGAVSANMRGTHKETQTRFRMADAQIGTSNPFTGFFGRQEDLPEIFDRIILASYGNGCAPGWRGRTSRLNASSYFLDTAFNDTIPRHAVAA